MDLLQGVGCTTPGLPIIYSPLDPDAVYARLYNSVQQAIIGRLDVLDNALEQLLGKIKQKRVVQHHEEIESVTAELLSKAEALKGHVPYAEANAPDNIRDFTGINTGRFYMLIREIDDVQTALGDLEREVGQLDVVAEPPQLTPEEQYVLDILTGHGHTDLAELSSVPEELDRVWNVVRALWEKQRIRIRLETVEQS
jgi:hypothetical protein